MKKRNYSEVSSAEKPRKLNRLTKTRRLKKNKDII